MKAQTEGQRQDAKHSWQETLTDGYDKAACLICKPSVRVIKDYNIGQRHNSMALLLSLSR